MATCTFTHESDIGRDDLIELTVTATVCEGEVIDLETEPPLSGDREYAYLMRAAAAHLVEAAADTAEFNHRLRRADRAA